MTQGVRLKFIGSSVQVGTGYDDGSSATPITAITQANPAVVTAAGHAAVEGDVVRIADVVGATQFNGNLYPVEDPTGTTFELANANNTNGAAYVSGGAVAEVVFSEICELTGAAKAGGGADQEEVSTICSTAKEFVQGLGDAGTLTLDYNYAPSTIVQETLAAAEISGATVPVKITYTDGTMNILIGTVQTTNFNGAIGQAVWKGNAVLKLSGPVFLIKP